MGKRDPAWWGPRGARGNRSSEGKGRRAVFTEILVDPKGRSSGVKPCRKRGTKGAYRPVPRDS